MGRSAKKTWKHLNIFLILTVIFLLPLSGCKKESQKESAVCTISIDCSAILANMDQLKETKAEFVPEDGWILEAQEVTFTTGDTVFDILKKVCQEKGIQISSRYTPLYKSYYVEGINQLYEFDCGKNSGWMYSVNDVFPNKGCSEYKPKDGDQIQWKYTCDLGSDVGNPYKEENASSEDNS